MRSAALSSRCLGISSSRGGCGRLRRFDHTEQLRRLAISTTRLAELCLRGADGGSPGLDPKTLARFGRGRRLRAVLRSARRRRDQRRARVEPVTEGQRLGSRPRNPLMHHDGGNRAGPCLDVAHAPSGCRGTPWHLLALRVPGGVVTEVEDHCKTDPEPIETVHPGRRGVEEHPHQRRERKEDEAE
jgi:hypothetical protein